MFYAGDEFADDDCTSGPYDPEPLADDFPVEGWDDDHEERRQ